MISPLEIQLDYEPIAKAIARVIALKHIATDPELRKLDALGKASAVTQMANNMWAELDDEAEAAANAVAIQMQEVWARSSGPNLQHAEGARLGEILRAGGLPVAGIEYFDAGHRIGVAFIMPDGKPMGFSFPVDEARLNPWLFAHAFKEAGGNWTPPDDEDDPPRAA